MAQINLHTTPDFEEALEALMRGRKLKTKSEAIRLAVGEAAAPFREPPKRDLSAIIGLIHRLPGGRRTGKTGAELMADIDGEMDRKLRRLGKRR
jgi:hypothetical protein